MDNIVESTTGDFPSKWVSQVGHYEVLIPFFSASACFVIFNGYSRFPDILFSGL